MDELYGLITVFNLFYLYYDDDNGLSVFRDEDNEHKINFFSYADDETEVSGSTGSADSFIVTGSYNYRIPGIYSDSSDDDWS